MPDQIKRKIASEILKTYDLSNNSGWDYSDDLRIAGDIMQIVFEEMIRKSKKQSHIDFIVDFARANEVYLDN